MTDRQYAIFDGRLRHLPGGVDEYLELSDSAKAGSEGGAPKKSAGGAPKAPGKNAGSAKTDGGSAAGQNGAELSGAERRAAEKEVNSIDRRLAKLADKVAQVHARMAEHDQSDYVGLRKHADDLRVLEAEVAELEDRWLELSEKLND